MATVTGLSPSQALLFHSPMSTFCAPASADPDADQNCLGA
jgi:hypothetical protein